MRDSHVLIHQLTSLFFLVNHSLFYVFIIVNEMGGGGDFFLFKTQVHSFVKDFCDAESDYPLKSKGRERERERISLRFVCRFYLIIGRN